MHAKCITSVKDPTDKGLLASIVLTMSLFASALSIPATASEQTSGNQDQPTIRFCYQDTELYPAYLGNGSEVPAEKPGVDIELVQKITARAGSSVSLLRYSWKRCLALLSAGRIDSIISSFRPERAQLAVFPMKGDQADDSKKITTSGYYLYHLNTGNTFWDGKNLMDPSISIGAPMGYSIVADLRRMNANVMEAGTTSGLLNLLSYGRFDAIAAPGNMTDAIIRQNITRFSDIVRDPEPLTENAYFIVFSKTFAEQHPSLVKSVWQNTEIVRQALREELLLKY